MTHHFALKSTLAIAALLMLPLAQAAGTVSKVDYSAGKNRISADYKADKAACKPMAGNAKDICIEEAKAKQTVARAELEFGYTGTQADADKVGIAKAKSAYAVAKERCDDLAGNPKAVCRKDAEAAEIKALADVKLGKKVGKAAAEASEDKRDANYEVAAQRCDILAGDAKANCIATAKARFGKS
jgi:hypothetical protein